MTLRNRQSQIPQGMRFYDPVTKYEAAPGTSFRLICEQWAMAIRGNGALARQAGLPTTMQGIEQAVEQYQVAICVKNGWNNYLQGGSESAAPFPQAVRTPQSRQTIRQSIKNVAAGSEILVEWIASGAEAVAPELANGRAAVCASCPLNEQGDWSRWFTVPVAAAIRKALDTRAAWKLSTPSDDRLMVCKACSCPLPLMVHVPLEFKLKRMSAETKAALDPGCWLIAEEKALLLKAVDEGLKKQ